MARIPYVDPATAHPKVREAFESLPAQLNIFRMMAHAERNFAPLIRLGGTILGRQQLSGHMRELAILFVAADSGARYEWVQHVPIAQREGVSDAQVQALEKCEIDADCFDADEKLALRFASEVVRDVRASDAVFEQMQQRFSHREIVELILAIGYYMMIARLMETTGIDLEPAAGTAIPDALAR